jgi:hypothetical protein
MTENTNQSATNGCNPQRSPSPLAAARDRFQASARDLMRNIETVMNSSNTAPTNNAHPNRSSPVVGVTSDAAAPPATEARTSTTAGEGGSLEQAFRLFFTSCTTGATMATADDDDGDDTDVRAMQVTPSSSSNCSLSSSRSSFSSRPPMRQNSSSAADNLRRLASRPTSMSRRTRSTSEHNPGYNRASSANRDNNPAVEHIYEQLFYDDHEASSRIQDVLPRNRARNRSPQQPQGGGGLSPNTQPKKRVLSKPFPVSSPPREVSNTTTTRSQQQHTTPSQGITIPESPTFDDNISAISAHTLEAMATNETPARSRSAETVTKQRNKVAAHAFPRMSSLPLARQHFASAPLNVSLNSNFTTNRTNTPNRCSTPQSRSTRTTHSSTNRSFEQWQNDERQFWEMEAAKDGTKKSSSRSTRRKRRGGDTLSTSSSTTWLDRHPHEIFPLEPSDVLLFDHGKLEHDSETAEI